MRKSIKAAVAGATAAAAVLVATPGTAFADTRSCTVPSGSRYCSAGDVPASAQKQVFVSTSGIQGRRYRLDVRDVTNGRIVRTGYYTTQVWTTLNNVYATYEANIQCDNNCPGMKVSIWN